MVCKKISFLHATKIYDSRDGPQNLCSILAWWMLANIQTVYKIGFVKLMGLFFILEFLVMRMFSFAVYCIY